MSIISILTPTYNRATELRRLYNSLINQKKIFEWVIVDDGSVDNTTEIVSSFMSKADFRIKYVKKENGGKHSALNVGINIIDSELTAIIDSDDYLSESAIENISNIHSIYKDNDKIATYAFLRNIKNIGNPVKFDGDIVEANYIDFRIRDNRPGDMSEVFKTKILKNYLFPEFKDELFLSEDVVWIEIGKKYDSVFVNKTICECEYLEDGLTSNDKKTKFSSPLGSMMRGKQLMTKRCGIIANIKGAIIYNAFYVHNNEELLLLSKRERLLVSITKPLGLYYRQRWKRNIK